MSARVLPERYLRVAQAARALGTTEAKVRELYDGGVLTGFRSEKGYRLIDPESVETYQPALRVTEAAHLLGVSTDTVRARFDAGELTGHRTVRGHRRIDAQPLREQGHVEW